ncbi:MAG: pyridoxal phosphate-dependent aminotransferase [Rhizobiaceae bacterium]|nr:pyridoxal phosphate-dependent aminotransferase [Rhizobiaceae bacterium]
MDLLDAIRPEARQAPISGIVAVMTHGWGRPGLIPLWVGEGDAPTPEFITRPAMESLSKGETFYTKQRGIPELREALAAYHSRHFGRTFEDTRFLVTGGGMQAIVLALQATVGAGDEVIYLVPAWPNISAATEISGAKAIPVRLDFNSNGWTFDPKRIEDAITPRTKALFINTPSNPTGWTADIDTLKAILDIARKHGLWIIADETYTQFHFSGGRAPSFLDVMADDDRVIFVNTFSKNWSMTGWRMGWVQVHPSLQQVFENLIQYSTSGVATFMQRGGVAALNEGDSYVASQVERARKARDIVTSIIGATGRARLVAPTGAFYLFFGIEGVQDSGAAAFEIVDRANVGLAPGTAFGSGGEAFFRLCFNRRLEEVEEGARRIASWISAL